MVPKKLAAYLLGYLSLLVIAMMFAFNFPSTTDFDAAKQEIMIRNIGHQLLLSSGDHTSRVLPVKKINENEFQLKFENEFSFQPDSLVNIVKNALADNNISENYIVNVIKCNSTDVIFGYAIFKNKRNNIMACSGRMQPKSCYFINLKFQNDGMSTKQKGYLLGSLPLLAFVGLLFSKNLRASKSKISNNVNENIIQFGNIYFHVDKQYLISNGIETELTTKESKLLLIFATAPNKLIERSRLQKEIWEDDGVIVGRSLDMFISKLRKKLANDPNIQLVNIHSKGYILKVINFTFDN